MNNFHTGSRFATNWCTIFCLAKILKSDDYLLKIAVLNHSRMTNSTRYSALKGVMIYWSISMKTSKPSNIKTPWNAQIKVLRWARELDSVVNYSKTFLADSPGLNLLGPKIPSKITSKSTFDLTLVKSYMSLLQQWLGPKKSVVKLSFTAITILQSSSQADFLILSTSSTWRTFWGREPERRSAF